MLTVDQKRAVAERLIIQAGSLVENWTEVTAGDERLDGVSAEDAAQAIGSWLFKLPGSSWDTRLNMPKK